MSIYYVDVTVPGTNGHIGTTNDPFSILEATSHFSTSIESNAYRIRGIAVTNAAVDLVFLCSNGCDHILEGWDLMNGPWQLNWRTRNIKAIVQDAGSITFRDGYLTDEQNTELFGIELNAISSHVHFRNMVVRQGQWEIRGLPSDDTSTVTAYGSILRAVVAPFFNLNSPSPSMKFDFKDSSIEGTYFSGQTNNPKPEVSLVNCTVHGADKATFENSIVNVTVDTGTQYNEIPNFPNFNATTDDWNVFTVYNTEVTAPPQPGTPPYAGYTTDWWGNPRYSIAAGYMPLLRAPLVTNEPRNVRDMASFPVSFQVAVDSYPESVYQWYKGSETIEGATNSTYSIAAIDFTDSNGYSCKITNYDLGLNIIGITNSSTATLVVLPLTNSVYYVDLSSNVSGSGTNSSDPFKTTDFVNRMKISNDVYYMKGTSLSPTAPQNIPSQITCKAWPNFSPWRIYTPNSNTLNWTKVYLEDAIITAEYIRIGSVANCVLTTRSNLYIDKMSNGTSNCIRGSVLKGCRVGAPLRFSGMVSNSTVLIQDSIVAVSNSNSNVPINILLSNSIAWNTSLTSSSITVISVNSITNGWFGLRTLPLYSAPTEDWAYSKLYTGDSAIPTPPAPGAAPYNGYTNDLFGFPRNNIATGYMEASGGGIAPVFITNPGSKTTNEGSTINLNVTVDANPSASLQWYKGSETIAGATSVDYIIASLVTTDAGSYLCRASNSAGVTNSALATINVLFAPRIYTQPLGLNTIEGTSGGQSIAFIANPSGTILWYKGGVAVTGSTSLEYFKASLVTTDAGSYTARVSNSEGATNSTAGVVAIRCTPKIGTQPQSQSVAEGADVTFSVVASANPAALGYFWAKDGVALATATNSSYSITNIREADSGTYTVLVSNSIGGTLSSGAVLTIGSIIEDIDNVPEEPTDFFPDLEGKHRKPGRLSVPFAGSAVLIKALKRIADGERAVFILERKTRRGSSIAQSDLILMSHSTWVELSSGTNVPFTSKSYSVSALIANIGSNLNAIVTKTLAPLMYTVLFVTNPNGTVAGVIILKEMYDIL